MPENSIDFPMRWEKIVRSANKFVSIIWRLITICSTRKLQTSMTVGGVGGLTAKTNNTSSANIESKSRCKPLENLAGQSTYQFSFQSILSSSMKQHFNNPHQKRLTENVGVFVIFILWKFEKSSLKTSEKARFKWFCSCFRPQIHPQYDNRKTI